MPRHTLCCILAASQHIPEDSQGCLGSLPWSRCPPGCRQAPAEGEGGGAREDGEGEDGGARADLTSTLSGEALPSPAGSGPSSFCSVACL